MAKKVEQKTEESPKKAPVKVFKRESFTLKTEVWIGSELKAKGDKVSLTKLQEKYFKSKNYI